MRYLVDSPILSGIFTAVVGFLTWLFGGWDVLMCVLVTLMAIDYITGLMVAYVTKTLSSAIGLKGLFKKIAELFVVMTAVQIDMATGQGGAYFKNIVCLLFIANEGLSLLENAGNLGVPIPDILKKALKQIGDKTETESEGGKNE
ncbi:phage holin family protein [Acetobacterium woodii]|uniref:Putative phage-like toxin secretion/phage lysis holin protein n=1 Tax=Acetobacterium woodii (strain ATCC 29683 / DSM 1030 / JCM 2381 / KCTC 1655 / WB1) TaxID=931626 RepID=H6LIS7_ACEWD|nr:phage holin family protein [Acetobacterium woodii]AFA49816.1 putative phage-like toxin secretion/phage lysis holin protein [Acetobacterium woodii DSM 1030]